MIGQQVPTILVMPSDIPGCKGTYNIRIFFLTSDGNGSAVSPGTSDTFARFVYQ